MGRCLDKLFEIASPGLGAGLPGAGAEFLSLQGRAGDQLIGLLELRNGFYAFESALHVLPATGAGPECGLEGWNSDDLWRSEYEGMASGCLFFAEDIFGNQFCIKDAGIFLFEAEAGTLEFLAENLELWAQAVLADYEVLTGFPVAHEWQRRSGALALNPAEPGAPVRLT